MLEMLAPRNTAEESCLTLRPSPENVFWNGPNLSLLVGDAPGPCCEKSHFFKECVVPVFGEVKTQLAAPATSVLLLLGTISAVCKLIAADVRRIIGSPHLRHVRFLCRCARGSACRVHQGRISSGILHGQSICSERTATSTLTRLRVSVQAVAESRFTLATHVVRCHVDSARARRFCDRISDHKLCFWKQALKHSFS